MEKTNSNRFVKKKTNDVEKRNDNNNPSAGHFNQEPSSKKSDMLKSFKTDYYDNKTILKRDPSMTRKDRDSMKTEQAEKALLQSISPEELIKTAKERIGPKVIFISLVDQAPEDSAFLYHQAKKKIDQELMRQIQKQEIEGLPKDNEVEEMFKNEIQNIFNKEIKKIETEKFNQIEESNKKLEELSDRYKKMQLEYENENDIPKSKKVLQQEIAEYVQKNKHIEDTLINLQQEYKTQNQKFKEEQKKLINEIEVRKMQAKSIQTEQYHKLLNDNKRLVNENIELMQKNKVIKDQITVKENIINDIVKQLEKLKTDFSGEMSELYSLKEMLTFEKHRLALERKEFEKQKSQIINQSLNYISQQRSIFNSNDFSNNPENIFASNIEEARAKKYSREYHNKNKPNQTTYYSNETSNERLFDANTITKSIYSEAVKKMTGYYPNVEKYVEKENGESKQKSKEITKKTSAKNQFEEVELSESEDEFHKAN